MTATTQAPPTGRAPGERRRWLRWVGTLVGLVVALVVLAPLATAGYVVAVSRQDDRTPTDVIVVLGAAQYWSKPSPVLEARLSHAQVLYEQQVARHIVTVGGNQPGDNTTEAQAGRAWLVAHGVPAKRVTAVPTGDDTLNSLTAVADLMAERGWTSATLVTDPAHEARSLAMSRALGMNAHTSPTRSGAGSGLTADYVVRETLGLLQFWLVQRPGMSPVVGAT